MQLHTSEGFILTFVCNLIQAAVGSSAAQGSLREGFFLLVVGTMFLACWVFNALGTDLPLMFVQKSRVALGEPGDSGCTANGFGGRSWNRHKTCGSG